jgi:hypothetical protein
MRVRIASWAFDHGYYGLMAALLTQNEVEDLLAYMDRIGIPHAGKINA